MTDAPAVCAARLAAGYYNSDDVSAGNPGGLGDDGHGDNLPALLEDVGVVAQQVGVDAAAVAADKAAVAADKADIAEMAADALAAIAAAITTVNTAKDTAVAASVTATNAAASVDLPVMTGGDAGKTLTWDGEAYAKGGPYQPATSARVQGKYAIWVPAAAMTARTTNGAASGTVESATNKIMRKTLDFDAATAEYAQFTLAMPKSWNAGTVSFQALWTAAGGSGGVAWSLQAVAAGDGDALDAAFGASQTVTDTLISAGAPCQTAESAAVTIAGAPAENDLAIFQLFRAVADGADTLAQDALLLGVRLFYTVNAGNDA